MKYPHEFIKKLTELGHDLIEIETKPGGYFTKECQNCGTRFTITGGWEKDYGWYEQYVDQGVLFYWRASGWDEIYPKETCTERLIREIIE